MCSDHLNTGTNKRNIQDKMWNQRTEESTFEQLTINELPKEKAITLLLVG